MEQEKNISGKDHPVFSKLHLSIESTELAHERTLMAWIRTAISLTTFGFTIYKFFQGVETASTLSDRILSPRAVGMVMIGFGFVGLLLALIQHRRYMNELRAVDPTIQRSLSTVIAVLILIYALLLFLGALFRQ
jgi:putative membrane protein